MHEPLTKEKMDFICLEHWAWANKDCIKKCSTLKITSIKKVRSARELALKRIKEEISQFKGFSAEQSLINGEEFWEGAIVSANIAYNIIKETFPLDEEEEKE